MTTQTVGAIVVTLKAMENDVVEVLNYRKGRRGNNIREVWEQGTVTSVSVHVYATHRTWVSYRVKTMAGITLGVTDKGIRTIAGPILLDLNFTKI